MLNLAIPIDTRINLVLATFYILGLWGALKPTISAEQLSKHMTVRELSNGLPYLIKIAEVSYGDNKRQPNQVRKG